jgi:hypothetical protein
MASDANDAWNSRDYRSMTAFRAFLWLVMTAEC